MEHARVKRLSQATAIALVLFHARLHAAQVQQPQKLLSIVEKIEPRDQRAALKAKELSS